jgi:hypothetical protein
MPRLRRRRRRRRRLCSGHDDTNLLVRRGRSVQTNSAPARYRGYL